MPEGLLARWRWLDAPYSRTTGATVYTKCRKGQLALVSVHGIPHYRGENPEEIKKPDLYTGGLTELVAELSGCHVVCHRLRVMDNNPHIGADSAEKILLDWQKKHGVQRVLDIHGARADCGFDLAIGTAGAPHPHQITMMEIVQEKAAKHGLSVAINPEGYAANGQAALTNRLRCAGVDGVLQIEICRHLRHPFAGSADALRLVVCLSEICNALKG